MKALIVAAILLNYTITPTVAYVVGTKYPDEIHHGGQRFEVCDCLGSSGSKTGRRIIASSGGVSPPCVCPETETAAPGRDQTFGSYFAFIDVKKTTPSTFT